MGSHLNLSQFLSSIQIKYVEIQIYETGDEIDRKKEWSRYDEINLLWKSQTKELSAFISFRKIVACDPIRLLIEIRSRLTTYV